MHSVAEIFAADLQFDGPRKIICTTLAAALTLHASGPHAAPARATPSTPTVSELLVTATKSVEELVVTAPVKCDTRVKEPLPAGAPRVVSSYPSSGQVVRPGLVVFRVTFDGPIACSGGLDADPPLAIPCSESSQRMVLTYDRRTVRTVCLLDPRKTYGAWVNGSPWSNFVGLNHVRAVPFRLQFTTSADAPTTGVCEALLADVEGLPPAAREHLNGCTAHTDNTDAVAAEVARRDEQVRRDDQARREREQALAAAKRTQAQIEAADLERAVSLGLAAYGAARDLEWARQASPDVGEDGAHLDGERAPATARPELIHWRQAFTVDGIVFDCAFIRGAVTCQKHD